MASCRQYDLSIEYARNRRKTDPEFLEKSREANRKSYRKRRGKETPEEKETRLRERRDKRKNKRDDLSKFHITTEQYETMFKEQNGLCAICKQPETAKVSNASPENRERIRRLAVDHDHDTGKIRQLLCSKCNAVIGFSKEDILILESAIKYLNKHKEISSHG